jgi:hypothetical protein
VARFLASQFIKSQSLTRNRPYRFDKPISIFPLSCVESKSLFVKVTEQVKGFNRYIRAFDTALQETPKVFDAVRVNLTINILFCMVRAVFS